MKSNQKSKALFFKACDIIPGGVNSPVRAFRSVGMDPPFIQRAVGARIWDVDTNEYLDFVGSWGPMILGHAHPAVVNAVLETAKLGLSFGAPNEREVELAQLIIESVPSVKMVRMVNSGTEAVMSALRVARAATKREKILKFEGCYHGHADGLLVKAGSGALTGGVPDSAGVPGDYARLTLTASYNDCEGTAAMIEANKDDLAAVIIEPVAANMGVVAPTMEFLNLLRTLCTQYGIILIFDEVITGFRLGLSGAQGYYNIQADLTVFGKVIGGGMPVGAYGGSKELMELVAPKGPVYQAGTLSGNPVAMAAGIATLKQLRTTLNIYEKIEAKASALEDGIKQAVAEAGIPVCVNRVGSLLTTFFTDRPTVTSFADVMTCDRERYATYFRAMLDRAVYMAPSQFEAMFVSAAHGESEINRAIEAVKASLLDLKGN
jgi:glutamate-1-semialdehyde 2,1-aminomutase